KKAIQGTDVVFIAVGTPPHTSGEANLEFVFQVAEDIGKYIEEYKVIVTKSTVPVGTTFKVKEIITDEIKKRNQDIAFSVASNPEFLKEGAAIDDFKSPDRVVIGVEDRSEEHTSELQSREISYAVFCLK